MSLSLENIIVNLKIISKLKIEDKLTINKSTNEINICEYNQFQGIIRWFDKSSNRDVTINHVKYIIDNAVIITDQYIDLYKKIDNDDYSKNRNLYDTIHSIFNAMIIAQVGLCNLRETYKSDANICSKIEFMKDKINLKCEQLLGETELKLN
jgi:hypothetical protein